MILKAIISKEDKMEEVFEITNYYTESRDYLEADIDGKGIEERQIILCNGNYLEGDNLWEQIYIFTNTGLELLKFINEVKQ